MFSPVCRCSFSFDSRYPVLSLTFTCLHKHYNGKPVYCQRCFPLKTIDEIQFRFQIIFKGRCTPRSRIGRNRLQQRGQRVQRIGRHAALNGFQHPLKKGIFFFPRFQIGFIGKLLFSITVRGKTINLGTFSTLEEAAAARKAAEIEYFKPIVDNWDSLQQRDDKHDSTD